MKRSFKLLAVCLLVVVGVVVGVVVIGFATMFYTHLCILDTAGQTAEKYAHYSIEKQPYTVSTYIIQTSDGLEFIGFKVVDNSSGKVVFEPQGPSDKWRTMDFKGIRFAENSYDIIVSSGDVGDVTYPFETWAQDAQGNSTP